jgi:hypothetical protein
MEMRRFPEWLPVMFTLLALFAPEDGLAEPFDHWRQRQLPQGIPLRVSQGNGLFLAVGESGILYTSPEGEAWTRRNSGTAYRLQDVAYGTGTFVAVGSGGTILTSSDGVTWISQSSGTSNLLRGVTYGNKIFVAVGDRGTILTSPDGAAWTARNSGSHQGLKAVAFGNNTFVAVGDNGTVLTSFRGDAWAAQSPGIHRHLAGIVHGKNTFVAVGEAIFISPDGVIWTERAAGMDQFFSGVAYGGGIFAAAGDDGTILTSPAGSEWIQRNSGTDLPLLAIAHGQDRFVAAGEEGILLQSDSLPSPQISVSPSSLDFGSVEVDHSSSQTLTVFNFGSANLAVSQLTISGTNFGNFTLQNNHCSGTILPPSQNCTVQIVFSPGSTGSKTALLSISSNDPDTPTATVPLNGSGSASGVIISSGSSGSFCFISFSASGSWLENYLDMLRKFRDAFLLTSALGKTLVGFYYRHSPSAVGFIAQHDFLRGVARIGLVPAVGLSWLTLYTSPPEKFLLCILVWTGVAVGFFILPGRSIDLRKNKGKG